VNRRSLIGFVLLNIMVTFLVAFLIIGLTGYLRPSRIPPSTPLAFIVTATTDPRYTPEVIIKIVTATPQPAGTIVLQPTPAASEGTTEGGAPPLPETLVPTGIGPTVPASPSPTDPSGCPTHTLAAGENPSIIASRYGVSLADLLAANNLTEATATRLPIGRRLILPVQGCGLPTTTPTVSVTDTRVPITNTPPPTSTDVPTAVESPRRRLDIVQIIAPGDITMEAIEIENVSGANIDMTGWKVKNKAGVTFTFPELTMFAGRRIVLFTRTGNTTPLNLFWGRANALWGDSTEVITITDDKDQVQLTYPISAGGGGTVPTPTPNS